MARSRFPTIGLKKLPEPTTSPVGAGVDDPAGWADAPAASNHPIATSASLCVFIGHPRSLLDLFTRFLILSGCQGGRLPVFGQQSTRIVVRAAAGGRLAAVWIG